MKGKSGCRDSFHKKQQARQKEAEKRSHKGEFKPRSGKPPRPDSQQE